MRLLLDANLSLKLCRALADLGEITHVTDVGLGAAPDSAIWEFARLNSFAIVSKDTDFYARSVLAGHPPKVICLVLGNCNTAVVQKCIRENAEAIRAFLADEHTSALILPARRPPQSA